MSAPEALLVLGTVALVLARWSPPRVRRPVAIGTVAVVVPAAIAVLVLGVRWQVLPVLAAATVATPFAVAPLLPRRGGRPAWRARWWLAVPASVACLGLVAAGQVAAWGFPVPEFPRPSGPFAVG
jgi:hypothetical protein